MDAPTTGASGAPTAEANRAWRAQLAVLGLYAVLCVINTWRHEPWRDELLTWQFARWSSSLEQLLHNSRYDGHQRLWHLLLYLVSRVTTDPFGMQVLHAGIVTTAVAVFVLRAPFTIAHKALFVLGYYPLFEYGTVCRNYALGMLMLFLFCERLASSPSRRYLQLFLVLSGAAQTSAYALLITFGLAATLLFELALDRERRAQLAGRPAELLAGLALYGSAVALGVVQLMPPPDSGVLMRWNFYWVPYLLRTCLSLVWRGHVPVSNFQPQFWNTNILEVVAGQYGLWMMSGLGLLVLVLAALSLMRRPVALFLYVSSVSIVLTFSYVKLIGKMRHWGFLYLALLLALWAARSAGLPELRCRRMGPLARWAEQALAPALLGVLLVVQAFGGLYAAACDWTRPFTTAPQVAAYIRDQGLTDLPIVGEEDASAAVVSAYVDRPVYYLRGMRWGTYVPLDSRRRSIPLRRGPIEGGEKMTADEVLTMTRTFLQPRPGDCLLLMSYDLPLQREDVRLLARFEGAITDESFWLYRVTNPRQTPNP